MGTSTQSLTSIKVVVLWESLTGFLAASLNQLTTVAEVFLVLQDEIEGTDFEGAGLLNGGITVLHAGERDIVEQLVLLDPSIVLVCGWRRPAYRRIVSRLRGRALRILYFDTQWRGTPRQIAGVVASHFVRRRLVDAALVPGQRQVKLAKRLGFPSTAIQSGFPAADTALFSKYNGSWHAKRFLYAGRDDPVKAVDLLIDAYCRYRGSGSQATWSLHLVGMGSERVRALSRLGISAQGFATPSELASIMAASSCLILPSRSEAWGVVIQEACAVGLPVIASRACGAGDEFVSEGNGWIVETGNVADLVRAMESASKLDEDQWQSMSERSREAAHATTPGSWVDDLLSSYQAWLTSMPSGNRTSTWRSADESF